jgi:hypothetical protein
VVQSRHYVTTDIASQLETLNYVVFLANFFDEVRRRVAAGK